MKKKSSRPNSRFNQSKNEKQLKVNPNIKNTNITSRTKSILKSPSNKKNKIKTTTKSTKPKCILNKNSSSNSSEVSELINSTLIETEFDITYADDNDEIASSDEKTLSVSEHNES